MSARAPGKLVLSGAYAVLEGAPALVAAVSRYVTADASREASFVTEEVRAAIALGSLARAPHFDASPLRVALADGTSRKLGVGSSAAILVASLGAAREDEADEAAWRREVESAALAAHHAAQPGGSGIDVVASVRGGVVLCTRAPSGALAVASRALPNDLSIHVFQSPVSASTPRLLEAVVAYAAADPAGYRSAIDAISRGSESAASATSAARFAEAIGAQVDALASLGAAAGAAIVTPEVASLRALAAGEGASFGPSGAGGGDVALFMGPQAPSLDFVARAAEVGLTPLDLTVGARGLHRVASAA